MIKEMYCIKDIVTGEIGNPMCFANEASAIRYFDKTVCASNPSIASDLQLFKVGIFDSSAGCITDIASAFIKAGEFNG